MRAITFTRTAIAAAAAFAILGSGCGSGGDTGADGAAQERPAADVAAPPPQASPVETCRDLAERERWSEALEPCTAAVAQRPDDLALQHALQQAQAATTR